MESKVRNTIGMLGGGGQAREIQATCNASDTDVAFLALSPEYIRDEQFEIDIAAPNDDQKHLPVIAAVGSPLVRKMLTDVWPGQRFATIIDNSALIGSRAEIGEGVFIAPGAILTTDIKIGQHTLINVGVTIGHDVQIGNYVTISPGVNIGGNVKISDGVFIGMGAVIKNGISLASGVVIGAGAVVLNSIEEENAVYVGVPAHKVGQNESWLEKI